MPIIWESGGKQKWKAITSKTGKFGHIVIIMVLQLKDCEHEISIIANS